jgi:hypothetical protein
MGVLTTELKKMMRIKIETTFDEILNDTKPTSLLGRAGVFKSNLNLLLIELKKALLAENEVRQTIEVNYPLRVLTALEDLNDSKNEDEFNRHLATYQERMDSKYFLLMPLRHILCAVGVLLAAVALAPFIAAATAAAAVNSVPLLLAMSAVWLIWVTTVVVTLMGIGLGTGVIRPISPKEDEEIEQTGSNIHAFFTSSLLPRSTSESKLDEEPPKLDEEPPAYDTATKL